MIPRELRTARLLLRVPRPEDAKQIFETYAQDPHVTRYLIWPPHRELAETERIMGEFIAAWETGERYPWVIRALDDDRLIGMIELRVQEFKADLGYVFARAEWGKGFATEALRAVVDAAFTDPAVYRVWAVCDLENPASARVMEKAGMTREGILRRFMRHGNAHAEPCDVYCYAKVR